MCYPWEQLTYIISAKRFLKKHLKESKYDVCHTHFLIPSGILAYYVHKKYNIPYVITAHGSDVPGYNPDRFKFLHLFTRGTLKKICLNAAKVVPFSNFLLELINNNIVPIKDKGLVIPNGVYPEQFKPLKKKKIILSTGRFLPRKGFQYLIQSVSSEDIGYEVHICGDGPMMDELKNLAEKSKTKVVFHGWVNNQSKEFIQLLGETSIFCLVSGKENASRSILEAMSAGCAVITSNTSGCPEMVQDTGIIIPPADPVILKEKLLYFINSKENIKKYGELARARILKRYDWNKLIKEYADLMKNCSSNKN
jgi:glycosyltransferase involved in cell wall biosynthesis